jgi:hypothetical protein
MSTELQTAPQGHRDLAPAGLVDEAEERLERLAKWALKLATASLCPGHLKAEPNNKIQDEEKRKQAQWAQTCANCLLVANQADRWRADIFAVAAETYVVQNKLGYQGKLVAAMVNTRANLVANLQPLYSDGKGEDFAAVIYGSKVGPIPDEAYPLLEA